MSRLVSDHGELTKLRVKTGRRQREEADAGEDFQLSVMSGGNSARQRNLKKVTSVPDIHP